MTIKLTAEELYEPSSGTEGEIFMSEFCYKCSKFPHDSDAKGQCMIVLSSMAWSVEDKEYPKQWRYVDDKPVCTSFKDRDEFNEERRQKRRKTSNKCNKTIDIFEV